MQHGFWKSGMDGGICLFAIRLLKHVPTFCIIKITMHLPFPCIVAFWLGFTGSVKARSLGSLPLFRDSCIAEGTDRCLCKVSEMLLENLKFTFSVSKGFLLFPLSSTVPPHKKYLSLSSFPFVFQTCKWPTENFTSKSATLRSEFNCNSSVATLSSFYFREELNVFLSSYFLQAFKGRREAECSSGLLALRFLLWPVQVHNGVETMGKWIM